MSRGVRRCEMAAMVYKKAVRILDLRGFYYHRRGEEAGERLWQKRRNATADKAFWESLQKVFSKAQEQPPVKLQKRPDIKLLRRGKAEIVLALPAPEPEPEASVVCCWCLREIGKKNGVEGVTHGCCEEPKRRTQKRELRKRFFSKVEEDQSTFGISPTGTTRSRACRSGAPTTGSRAAWPMSGRPWGAQ